MMEKKYAIPGFPGYRITKTGKVWSDKTNKFLSIRPSTEGYRVVGLQQDNKNVDHNVARLLLTTFTRPPKSGELCRHLNDIRMDDALSNLAWGTCQDNIDDMFRNGHQHCCVGEQNGCAKLFPMDVINILCLCVGRKHTQSKIARMYGIDSSNVSDIKFGKSWKHIHEIWSSTQ